MTAQELRIGNYVEEFLPVKLWTKIEVNYQDLKFVYFEDTNSFYRPIPITEEWLLKLGFEKTKDYGDKIFYDKEHFYVCFDDEDLSFGIVKNNEYTCLIYDEQFFSFIHQLQNAFFALTGRELTIKQ